MNYGSRNTEEESEFIRRVVAPPKRSDSSRRKQKRMAAVGGAVALLAAGATVAYVAMPGDGASNAVATETLEANVADGFVIPDEEEEDEVLPAGPIDVPHFTEYDIDGDGTLSPADFRARLEANRDSSIARVLDTEYLSATEKDDLIAQIKKNYDTSYECILGLTEASEEITPDNFPLFYSLMEFCQTEVTIREEAAKAAAIAEAAKTAEPATTVVVDTPSGPAAVDIPAIDKGEPSTVIVVDTPAGPTVIEVPVPQDNEPTTTIVVETPTGPTVIEVPTTTDETSAPATTVVVDTPSGPAVVEIPPVQPNEPTTTVVVDTPSGPTVIEVPVPQDNEPTTTIVVDTPDGPEVLDIPVENPTIVPASEVLNKQTFLLRIAKHFDYEHMALNDKLLAAKEQVAVLALEKDKLEKCIIDAADKFAELGDADEETLFNRAVNWVSSDCLGK